MLRMNGGPKGLRAVGINVLLCAVYIGAARLGLRFASVHPSATAIWPPTGIAIAAFLLFGTRVWPAIVAGAFIANTITAGSLATSAGIAVGNTLEGLIGARLVDASAGGRFAFTRAPDVFRFAALAGVVATLVSPSIGVTSLAIGGYARWSDYGSIWLTWWLGDLAGALIVAPFFITWSASPAVTLRRSEWVEAGCLLAALAASSLIVFAGLFESTRHAPLAFLCLPPLVWAAFRFGPRGTATAIAILSASATWGTLRGSGPFAPFAHGELILQAFMATLAVTSLAMAALVAERKRIEADRLALLSAEQQARRDAESANLAKDQFLAMLGHELRNPLAAIATAAHITEHRAIGDESVATAQDVITRQVAHLTNLVDDLLDAARVSTDKVVLARAPIDVSSVVGQCLETMAAAHRTDHHDVEFYACPAWVNGDSTRLEQIVTNLLANAIKYTPAGGTIRLAIGVDERHVTLTVADNGIGIEPNLLPYVFDLFAQGARGLDRSQGGLGIGLTLVKRLAELHDGTVAAASDGRNRGSTFTVTLPRIAPSPSPDAARLMDHVPPPRVRATRRVLLVEDQDDIRTMLRVALEAAGHEIFEAADGPAAIDAVARYRPQAAVVDIGIPVFDGFEVARRVRQMPDGGRILLVALTGYGQLESRQRAEAAGFDVYLIKPVDPDHLSELLVTRTYKN